MPMWHSASLIQDTGLGYGRNGSVPPATVPEWRVLLIN
jgi:hypothetical protein